MQQSEASGFDFNVIAMWVKKWLYNSILWLFNAIKAAPEESEDI